MRSCSLIVGFVVVCITYSLSSCVPEEVFVHGELSGKVTDDLTSDPIPQAKVQLSRGDFISDTSRTGEDGVYQFTALKPWYYEVEVSKKAYRPATKMITVVEGEVAKLDFEIEAIPDPAFSVSYLDFGLEGAEATFSVYNEGAGEFQYSISTSQEWITMDPSGGTVSDETDIIRVSINREGLPGNKVMEEINILSYLRDETQLDTIHVFLNGIMDDDNHYYGVTTIGTQTWLAENLNTGKQIMGYQLPSDNDKVEKYCFEDDPINCDIYGGLYTWHEMMDYNPEDAAEIGTTQGICPDGWHLPTYEEFETLINFAGGFDVAGGKLRNQSMSCWDTITNLTTNEFGFSALGGGWMWQGDYYIEHDVDGAAGWWITTDACNCGIQVPGELFRAGSYWIHCWDTIMQSWDDYVNQEPSVAYSVRCIRDP